MEVESGVCCVLLLQRLPRYLGINMWLGGWVRCMDQGRGGEGNKGGKKGITAGRVWGYHCEGREKNKGRNKQVHVRVHWFGFLGGLAQDGKQTWGGSGFLHAWELVFFCFASFS